MIRKVKMNTVRLSLLFLFMISVTSTLFAGEGDDGEKIEPD
jgi:hypothetical protein